ncbi:uncharacterized protein LOC124899695 isoform X2 [Capsicum annuum]|uniref:uncharacterized protein LOC124899695 isoform X2 n=1 Tax=Capsicum annuum TaxID=4072 RepID=UPI001FB16DDF|nr:uncharacterized protein LOC124899695 isoform X2 [Capsicum annuum]
MYPFESKKKHKDDWAAVLKVKPQNIIELPDEEIKIATELSIPFKFKEVEVYKIDMNVATVESIHLYDPNGYYIKVDGPINNGLFQEHHEIQEEATKEEYATEETEDEEEKDFEEDTDSD